MARSELRVQFALPQVTKLTLIIAATTALRVPAHVLARSKDSLCYTGLLPAIARHNRNPVYTRLSVGYKRSIGFQDDAFGPAPESLQNHGVLVKAFQTWLLWYPLSLYMDLSFSICMG